MNKVYYDAWDRPEKLHATWDMTLKEYMKANHPVETTSSSLKGTFRDLLNWLEEGEDVYSCMNNGESQVREDVFKGLANLMDVPYKVIYEKWLSIEKTKGFIRILYSKKSPKAYEELQEYISEGDYREIPIPPTVNLKNKKSETTQYYLQRLREEYTDDIYIVDNEKVFISKNN